MSAHRLLPSVAFLVAVSSFFIPPVLSLAGVAPHRDVPRQRLEVRPAPAPSVQLSNARCLSAPGSALPAAVQAAPRRSVVAMAGDPIR